MGETQLDQMEKDRFNDSTDLMSKRTDLMASIDLNSKSVKVIDLNSKSVWTVNRGVNSRFDIKSLGFLEDRFASKSMKFDRFDTWPIWSEQIDLLVSSIYKVHE